MSARSTKAKAAEPAEAPIRPRTVAWALLGFVLLFAGTALASVLFRVELEAFGRSFVDRFGNVGVAAGAFLADGLRVPLPPQFYLLAAITAGGPIAGPLASVCAGSIVGGLLTFVLARHVGRWKSRRPTRSRLARKLEALLERHGTRAVLVAGVLPVSYWLLCATAGFHRLPYRVYALLALLRIPRLLVSFVILRATWSAGAPG